MKGKIILIFIVLALLKQASTLSCQIIDQNLPPTDAAECSPAYTVIFSGVNANYGDQYSFFTGSPACGRFSVVTQYFGETGYKVPCGVAHGGEGDVSLGVTAGLTFLSSGDSCVCAGQATITCNSSVSVGLIVGLVIGGLVVLGVVGFFVYKKFIKKGQAADYQNMATTSWSKFIQYPIKTKWIIY